MEGHASLILFAGALYSVFVCISYTRLVQGGLAETRMTQFDGQPRLIPILPQEVGMRMSCFVTDKEEYCEYLPHHAADDLDPDDKRWTFKEVLVAWHLISAEDDVPSDAHMWLCCQVGSQRVSLQRLMHEIETTPTIQVPISSL